MPQPPHTSVAIQSRDIKCSRNIPRHFFPCCRVHQPAHHRLQEDLSSHPVTDAFGIELFITTALDWVCGEHEAMTANGALCPYISSCTKEESTWVNATLRREETFLRACAYDSWCVC